MSCWYTVDNASRSDFYALSNDMSGTVSKSIFIQLGHPVSSTPKTVNFAILSISRGMGYRYKQSRSSRSKSTSFQLDALPFSLSPSEAHAKFERWGNEQGIGPLLSIGSTKLTAAYTPFWYFNLNVRFIEPNTK